MAMVNLMKKQVSYEKDGGQKTATNFFAKCGDILVPIEVKYFENKDTGRDDRYRERRVLLSAFAEELPDLPDKKSGNGKPSKKPVLEPCDPDGQSIPF